MHTVLQTALLIRESARVSERAGSGNCTHICSLEDCGPYFERYPHARLSHCPCRRGGSRRDSNSHCPGANREFSLLNYGPAGREGIEPSRMSFGGSAVTRTLRPVHCCFASCLSQARARSRLVRELNPPHSRDSGAATPVASRGIHGIPGRTRTCIFTV